VTFHTRNLIQTAAFVVAVSFSFASFAQTKDNATTEIQKAMTISDGISARDTTLATKYIDPQNFKNHNPMAYDGIDGVKGFITHMPPGGNPLKVVRAFQDGPYVFTQSEGDLFGQKVFFDIYRFDHGLIVEHWDNMTDVTPPNQSGHTPIDGPTKATDLKDTEKNKQLVRNFYETIFLKGQFDQMSSYFNGDNFIRHDARGGDGLSALGALIQEQAKKGVVMTVSKINLVLGQGDFVLVAASGSIAGKPVAYYDLFRVQNSKIAEHWDVIEDIPSPDQFKNQNGKF
jgi:predicted SnoaL-like aldol condensation-catalyzing enzyme